MGPVPPQAALTARSCAMWAREPGQVRKEAALSGSRHVMQASLARANRNGHARELRLEDGCTVHLPPFLRTCVRNATSRADITLDMRGITLAALLVAVFLVVVGTAGAERKPTTKEKAQIASIARLPAVCARVRIATTSKKPKWGSVSWHRGGSQCEPLASNGVTIVKKSAGRWHFITAGSSFDCKGLYDRVPKPVVKDLRIRCT